eukprot:scaffold37275_cov62-Phaeocystis_antarctica.AAC.3
MGYACQPAACCAYLRRRAACPWAPRAVRTAYRGTPGAGRRGVRRLPGARARSRVTDRHSNPGPTHLQIG